ncbi:MAG: electron transfer flavoprotein subunit alpha/FixB family protein [Chloroflexi bacterium]|nr:electron transfer flavoprotein subunit alpha/FixB family protein [Chloroflexota bacterium]
MSDSKGSIWVIAEQLGGKIPLVSFQLIGQARKLADEMGGSVGVVLLGNDFDGQIKQLIYAGGDTIYLGGAPEFEFYQADIFTEVIVSLAQENTPEIILLGSTFMGRELAPLIAARLQTGLTAHCVDLALDESQILEQRIPAYSGMITIVCPEKRPQMATAAMGVFPTPELDENRTGEIVPIDPPQGIEQRVQILEIVHQEPKGVALTSARTVVAGGAGAGSLEGWNEIEALAEVLNAGLGSTRPAVDQGWTELETMIGQSGKMVSPDLYIGVGLSGEQQHMVGLGDTKVMVAINNDPKSPVFEKVDFGIVEDCRQFVPILIEKLKQYKEIN